MGQLFSPSAPILNETESWKLHLQFAPQATFDHLRVIASHVHYGTDGTAHLVSLFALYTYRKSWEIRNEG